MHTRPPSEGVTSAGSSLPFSSKVLPLLLGLIAIVGCGAPGDPLPPSPPVPQAITDLSAKQAGDGVLLTFTMPTKSTLGERLQQTPTIEILRGALKQDGEVDPKSFRVADTVPGALVSRYIQRGIVRFVDPLPIADQQVHPGQLLIYRVKTSISEKRPSVDSNDASLTFYPAAQRIVSLEAIVTEPGIQLKWSAPSRNSLGEPLNAVQEFHIYRGELDPSSITGIDLQSAKWNAPLQQIASIEASDYRDSGFDYGKTYAYIVRTVIQSPIGLVESSDSSPAIVTPKDIFPPAAPQNLVAAILPQASTAQPAAELSWAINVEPDLAGYRVYRASARDQKGELLTHELLPTPSFRDSSVQRGQSYWYTVTAVDRSGNESGPSTVAVVDFTQPSR